MTEGWALTRACRVYRQISEKTIKPGFENPSHVSVHVLLASRNITGWCSESATSFHSSDPPPSAEHRAPPPRSRVGRAGMGTEVSQRGRKKRKVAFRHHLPFCSPCFPPLLSHGEEA